MTTILRRAGTVALPMALVLASPASGGQWDFTEVVIDPNPLASKSFSRLQVSDFNGDGLPDLLVSNDGDSEHQMFWYRNHGDRETRWDRYGIMPGTWQGAAAADVNQDQEPDIIAYSEQERASYVILNDGSPEDRGWGRHPLPLAGESAQFGVVDLDRDQRPELVAVIPGSSLQLFYQSNANEWTAVELAHASNTTTVSLADLDGNGSVDIAVGNTWLANPFPDQDWRDAGNWTLQTVAEDAGSATTSLIADIDNDGRHDIILTEPELGVVWFKQPEEKGLPWQPSVIMAPDSVSFPIALAVADLDGDHKIDLVVGESSQTSSKRLLVLERPEDGALPWSGRVVAEVGADALAVADFNGDGYIDIASKNVDGDTQLRIWFNDFSQGLPLERWRRHVIDADLQVPPLAVTTADLDGDSLPDIAASTSWWRNPGVLSDEWKQHDIGAPLRNVVAVHDLDDDGDTDMIGTNGGDLPPRGREIYWAENNGGGVFNVRSVGSKASGDFPQSVQVGPLIDGDDLTVAISWHNAVHADPPKGTQIYRVPADARIDWEWSRLHEFSTGEDMAFGDIDGDGDLDVHLGTLWLRNDGDERFHPLPAVVLEQGRPGRVRLHDIDHDSFLDVILTVKEDNQVVWGQNPGTSSSGKWLVQPINLDPIRSESLDVADLDQDGDVDVVVGEHRGRGRVFVFENRNDGSEWVPRLVESGALAKDDGIFDLVKKIVGAKEPPGIDHRNGTRLIDLDGDGDLDIVSAGWYPKVLLVYENLAIDKAAAIDAVSGN